MLKLLAAAAALVAVASTVHADNACYTSCDQECLRTGSLARDCQIECTQECPAGGGSTPTCTTVTDSSAHDACVANDVAWEASCVGLLSVIGGPFGTAYCTSQFLAGVKACPQPVTTTVCH